MPQIPQTPDLVNPSGKAYKEHGGEVTIDGEKKGAAAKKKARVGWQNDSEQGSRCQGRTVWSKWTTRRALGWFEAPILKPSGRRPVRAGGFEKISPVGG